MQVEGPAQEHALAVNTGTGPSQPPRAWRDGMSSDIIVSETLFDTCVPCGHSYSGGEGVIATFFHMALPSRRGLAGTVPL